MIQYTPEKLVAISHYQNYFPTLGSKQEHLREER